MSVTNEIGRGPVLDHVRTNRSGAAIRGVLWSVVNSFAPAALGILVFMATSRVLSPAEFGIVSYAASIAMLGTAIAPAGFSEAIIQRSKIEPRHLDTVFWLCTGAALLIYAGLCFAAFPLANQLNEPILNALLPFIGIRVIFDMAAAVPNALLVRSMSFKKLAMRTTVASVVAALLCLALLWLGFGLWALAFSQLATAITTCIGALVSVRWLPKFRFSFQALRELASFGLFASGNRIITLVSIDQLLIGTLLGPAGLGIYSFARRIFQILTDLITGALSSVSYALLSSLQNERDKLREAYFLGTFASSVLSFPVFMGLALIADDFVPLAFGHNWVEAVPAVQAFCLLGLITSIGVLQSSLVKSQGQADLWFYYLIGKQVTTVLYVVLFYKWGVNALTLAIVIQNFIMWPPSVHMVIRILRVSAWAYLGTFATPVLATALMIGAGIFVKLELVDAHPVLRLAATVAVCAAVYGGAILVLARKRLLAVKGMVLKKRKAKA
ncbi:lipopolysaccharide biosynthesis protein [Devosia neptuniae]|uniref:Lipopolysaccharide biosynthesis protein n=1 Tax=Devosia neptuniae TaxID=191302 RepID=A0ABY6CDP0_9HYPH|nr:lipopolysaccharide biosynthesis protein [Devosia neptuniae]UXN69086.1 lipopolysaccharide biosynthesis protein [Devosia neptuniae]